MGLEQMDGPYGYDARPSDARSAYANSAYATPLTEDMPDLDDVPDMPALQPNGFSKYANGLSKPANGDSKSVEHIKIPREIRAVKDAESYEPTGKNIVICLDGTGDQFDADNSNIVHFVSCLKKAVPEQVTYYQSGIGTYDGGGVTNGINAGLDMAVGSGLGVHIRDAYMFIQAHYKQGDKICLLGFSRGAYTARCLAGMIHKVGLLPAGNVSQVPFAYKYYKDDTDEGWEMSQEFRKTFCIPVNVYFVGVFDSVASVGFFPRKLPLSSTPTHRAEYFRHAMALDEHRAKFKACRYKVKDSMGEKYTVSAEEDVVDTDVREVWFTGCHADVGGGAVKNEVRHKLAQIPLRWMIRQCFECDTGIIFKTPNLANEGLDIHTLWPKYEPLSVPTGPPPPDMLDRYHKGLLGPIHRRSSLLEPVDHNDEYGMHHLKIYKETDSEKPSADLHEHWTPEQVEDYFDALQKVNDQLVDAKGWWVLELWPIKIRHQAKDSDAWVKKIGLNLGTYRAVQDKTPNLHWTVKHRTDQMEYRVRTRMDRKAEWRVVV
ncbi:hypothetical protein CBER1_02349 [Cercospora berteroae]|uniref:T6SS Phospholipase effector Tle1-like catalytic domain-containing protein n=1 Tax=Cercospora berteroae TaxID=357750 RepID=A0A2S6CM21_9PEZI|nr:hypothetical protein CBER1_02349 [Cercospora berteroae]